MGCTYVCGHILLESLDLDWQWTQKGRRNSPEENLWDAVDPLIQIGEELDRTGASEWMISAKDDDCHMYIHRILYVDIHACWLCYRLRCDI